MYKPVKDKIWEEAEKELGLKESAGVDPQGYIESFLKRYADSEANMIYQSVLLEPVRKATPLSKCTSKKVKPLSCKQRKTLGLRKIQKNEQNYSLYKPLNELWNSYMIDLLKPTPNSNCKQLALKALKADWHGCLLKVTESSCHGNIGIEGIIIRETQNTFQLITTSDRILTIPKVNTIFQFKLKGHCFTLYGNQLRFRPGDRTARKFKDKFIIDLEKMEKKRKK